MTLNLNEARRLHDRDPDNLSSCLSGCTEVWPCPTALALGATGRSEWVDTPSSAMATQCPATGTTEHGPSRCVLTTSHHGDHTAPNGLIIEQGNTTNQAGTTITVCGEPHPDNPTDPRTGDPFICLAPPRHFGHHLDHDGDTWTNTNAPC